jgi:MFS family permease
MAWVSIELNVGLTLGPLLGGIVYDRGGWYATFSVGFAFLALDIFMRTIMIEKSVAERYRPVQISIGIRGDQSADQIDKVQDLPRDRKRVPEVIRLLRFPRMIAGMWLALAQATIISSLDAALPLHLNRLFGWTSLQVGITIHLSSDDRIGVFGDCYSALFRRSAFGMDVGYLWT